MAVPIKEKRIELRLPEEAKITIAAAAELSNISLSSYVLNVVLKQAKLDLERNEMIILNNRERDLLMRALDNPPKPNQALKDLFK